MKTTRTFVAIELAPGVRGRIAQLIKELSPHADLKWVATENLHLTVKFLGDVENTFLPEVCREVAKAAASVEPFELASIGLGAFPNTARPKTIWVGAQEGASEAIQLAEAVEKALKGLGFPRETRRFEPHVTIGRTRRGGAPPQLAELLDARADFDAGQSLIEELVVFASELTPQGPVYTAVTHAPLGAE